MGPIGDKYFRDWDIIHGKAEVAATECSASVKNAIKLIK